MATDEHHSPTTTTTAVMTASSTGPKRERPTESRLFGKSTYKFWVLAAILLLAFWSMLTGSVTLKWSAGNLARFSSDLLDSPSYEDLDILEVEQREKVVRHMWDVYTQSKSSRLPKFWQEAFQAGYEFLTSDVPGVRDVAVSEIAKMSLRSFTSSDPLAAHSHSVNDDNQREASAIILKAGQGTHVARIL
ncbi:uncharacterized protein LOC115751642 [Rhodamnia argentea]|uniref:Uncharacterized protein LOC115751642 n=1 Tax=Rhodamnia argentea TaxID=178133 RepID=A0A8B8QEA7_9MYRT|nr:uncharacterized protein LOC115751642 [Rhodamnia argentea]